MNHLRIIPVVVLCLFSASTGWSRTYYVAQEHPKASDSNPGTEELPRKTIQGGLREIWPGDTLFVKKGTYREQVIFSAKPWNFQEFHVDRLPFGKSFSEMIHISAMPGEDVIIKGSDVVADWKADHGNVWVRENWDHNSQQVFCDGEILTQIAGQMVPTLTEKNYFQGRKGEGLNDMEAGSFYFDQASKRLYVWLKDNSDPNQHLIEASTRPFLFVLKDVNYVSISGFKMSHSNTSGCINWAAIVVDGTFNILENLDVSWCDFGGLLVNHSNNTVVRCRFNHCGNNGMGGTGWGHRFINCETSYNNYRNWDPEWHAGGAKFTRIHDTVVSGHRATHNHGQGIWFDIFASSVTVQDAVAGNNSGNGIMYEISERATIKNNTCYENGKFGIYISNSSSTMVAHNLCYKNGMPGIVVIGVEQRKALVGRESDKAIPARNNTIWGNILVDNCNTELSAEKWANWPEMILPDQPGTLNTGTVSDYNIFYRTDGRKVGFWLGWGTRRADDLRTWQMETKFDRHSVLKPPAFVNPEEHDFRPRDGSPALRLVRPLMAIAQDASGANVDLNAYQTAGPFQNAAD